MVLFEKVLKVLNIESSENESKAIQQALTGIGHQLFFERVTTKAELLNALRDHSWSIIISDIRTDALEATEALTTARSKCPDLPFIMVSGNIGEESVADMMKAGVEDFVSKARLERLMPVVKRILREHEIKDMEARAHRLADEAHAAKEQMLAIVSHDIKNPLSAIRLEAQMLLRVADRHKKSVLSEEVKIQAGRILKTTDRLRILISDLLDKNKTESGLSALNKTEVGIHKLYYEVLDACRPHLKEKEISINSSLPEGVKKISIDRNKMFQVLSNLLSNAIKFTPQGGAIRMSFEENEHHFIFSITDSGPGLKADDLPRVFEKYWTGKSTGCSGTGLGLFICKTIVKAHEGDIMVENSSEGGARFFFTLPKKAASSEMEAFSYYESPPEDTRKRILILDDDEDLREVISWALDKEGYVVDAFQDPQEALLHLRSGRKKPDLILADYHMEGMKGGEFLTLKNDLASAHACPVVMISASPSEVEREVAANLYKEIITKPVDLEGLVGNMRKYLN
jgi:signal transduction histidine kinase